MQDFGKISWPPEQEQIIYREWGLFYTKKQKRDIADLYYSKSLNLNSDDPKALYNRSRCKRYIAQTQGGLTDARKAFAIDPTRQPFNLEVCDGIYELNNFENCMLNLSNYSRKFSGKKVDAFNIRMDILRENFNDALGVSLGYYILGNEDYLEKVQQDYLRRINVDTRPLWKILREQNRCDAMSIPDIEEVILKPIEVVRRKCAFAVFNQIYLRRSWIDVIFLKALRTNPDLLLPQSQWSRPILEVLTKKNYDVVLSFLKMLHARCPLYTQIRRNCPNVLFHRKKIEDFLSRVQYQVHRSMLQMLKKMHELRKLGSIEKLRRYIEEVMGDYVVLKTQRVMPWKFQFLNEVYNIYALALCDRMRIPEGLDIIPQKDRLCKLLRVNTEIESEPIAFEFGNKSSYQDSSHADKLAAQQKAMMARLTKRIIFAKHPIERAYLWHEVALLDMQQNSFDRCCLVAERSFAEAEKCRSYVWMLHSTMLQCKANSMLKKIEKVKQNITKALKLQNMLRSDVIKKFLRKALLINKRDMAAKKVATRKTLITRPPAE